MTEPTATCWADDPEAVDEVVRRRLATRAPAVADGPRRAAVTVSVLPHRGRAHVLVIKRSFAGRNAGQWALPGGRVEDGEEPDAAAVRELAEETGLHLEPTEIAGRLDDLVTESGFVITPLVAVVRRPVRLRRDPREIHSLHPVPLRRLLAPGVPRWKHRPAGAPLLQLPLRHDMVVHAPTGALLWQFREVALLGNEVTTADLVQPAWTHT